MVYSYSIDYEISRKFRSPLRASQNWCLSSCAPFSHIFMIAALSAEILFNIEFLSPVFPTTLGKRA